VRCENRPLGDNDVTNENAARRRADDDGQSYGAIFSVMKVFSTVARVETALSLSSSNTTDLMASTSFLLDVIPPFNPLTCQRRLFLLRHGETDWNARGLMQGGGYDIELNKSGYRQAELLSQEIVGVSNINIGVVASSHLKRAKQTAHVLHRNLLSEQAQGKHQTHPHVISMKEFGEMRFGALEGNALRGAESTQETRNLFAKQNAKMQLCMDYAYPGGGESVRCVEKRGIRGVETLYQQYPDADSIAIVAHGRFNKVLIASLLYGDALQYPRVNQGNTCINVIDQCHDGTYEEVVLSYMDHITREREQKS